MRVNSEYSPAVTNPNSSPASGSSKPEVSAPNIDLSNLVNSAQVNVSKLSLPSALYEHLLPANFALSPDQDPSLEGVATNFVIHSENVLKLNFERAISVMETTKSLAQQSNDAHNTVRDMFAQMGQLDSKTDEDLTNSQNDIATRLGQLADNYTKYKPSKGIAIRAAFNVEMTTMEGDKIAISFSEKSFTSVMDNVKSGLGMQIEGEISEQEAEALGRLYQDIEKYIEESMGGAAGRYSMTAFDLSESFDSSVLSGFTIKSENGGMRSEFGYQIDLASRNQTMHVQMQGSGLEYEMDITTALDGSSNRKEKVLETLQKSLDEMNVDDMTAARANKFFLDSFDSMLSNEGTQAVERDPDLITAEFLNPFIQKRDVELGMVGLDQLSELPDYSFSLDMEHHGSNGKGHETTINMAQKTEMVLDGTGLHVKQEQTNKVDMYKYQMSWDRLAQREEHWELDEAKVIKASFKHNLDLMRHEVSGHREEMKSTTYYDHNYQKRIDTEKQKHSYRQVLEVFDARAKLTSQANNQIETAKFTKDGDKASVEVGRSRLVREYEQVLNFERKNKL